ncbi:MAG: LacI family transcriptional regulator [Actinomycetota bacterium]|nr:LacI family transcriptional regulator [Actinomycetota bacterium]
MAVTIRDVARAAGVSPSTVSRALSLPDMVDPTTRDRVLRVATHLGYQPNRAARGLITGRTGNLGLLLPDLANPFFPSMVKAIQRHAHQADYQVLMMDTDEDPTVELALVRSLAKQVDGIILCAPRMRPQDLREAAAVRPTVLVNRTGRRLPAVTFDNHQGMHQVVTYLAGLGHTDIGFVGGPRSSWSNAERLRGLRDAAGEAGVRLAELGNFTPNFAGGLAATDGVIVAGVTAVLAYNDLVALGLVRSLAARGIDVPGRLSVVGIDDIAVSSMIHPGLTSLGLPTGTAGRAAVDMLLQLLSAPGPGSGSGPARTPHIDIPTELVVRETTGPVGPAPPGPKAPKTSAVRLSPPSGPGSSRSRGRSPRPSPPPPNLTDPVADAFEPRSAPTGRRRTTRR